MASTRDTCTYTRSISDDQARKENLFCDDERGLSLRSPINNTSSGSLVRVQQTGKFKSERLRDFPVSRTGTAALSRTTVCKSDGVSQLSPFLRFFKGFEFREKTRQSGQKYTP